MKATKNNQELTQNEKLSIVFEKLMTYLSPVEKSKRYYKPEKSIWNCHPGYTEYFAECNFLNAENIPLPFNDILIEAKENNILIMAENFEMNIAPDQILTIYTRMKKALKN